MTSTVMTHFLEKDNEMESSDTSLWYVKKSLYAFMKSQLPNTFYYGVFFICYILMLVMIAYYYLRKIKKERVHLDCRSCSGNMLYSRYACALKRNDWEQ